MDIDADMVVHIWIYIGCNNVCLDVMGFYWDIPPGQRLQFAMENHHD